MKRPYYLFSNGRLRRKQNTLFLERATDERTPDDDQEDTGEPSGTPTGDKVPFPVEQVDAIYVFGEIDINTKLVTFLAQNSIPTHFFDYYGHYTATLYPRAYLHSGRLKVQQVVHYLDDGLRLKIARALVDAATYNILRVLKYYATRAESAAAAVLNDTVAQIEAERTRIPDTWEIPELMGVEGRSRDGYYGAWPAILGDGPGAASAVQ